MKFLLDESADYPLAEVLVRMGHDVTTIVRDYPRALKDREVLALAQDEGRIVITNDTDFGELIFRQQLPHAGVILFRLGREDIATKAAWLKQVIENHADQLSQFVVVTDRGVRVRKTLKA
jgi:predicted nuclease of predicted toxin-antitoxin system